MKYAKLVNNVVVQVQPNKDVNCEVEVNDNVTCGMELVDDTYIIPVIELTQEQIDIKLKAELKLQREEALRVGVIVDGIWFNENYLGNFVNAINVIERSGGSTVQWKDDLDAWVTLTIDEASNIALQAMIKIQLIYKEN